jgi:hypothetical protein
VCRRAASAPSAKEFDAVDRQFVYEHKTVRIDPALVAFPAMATQRPREARRWSRVVVRSYL